MEREIEYYVINLPKSGKQKQDFFQWALNHKLYKVDNSSSFNSRMKAVYQGRCPTKEITAVIAIVNNEPVAMTLCEDMDQMHNLYTKQKEGIMKGIPPKRDLINGQMNILGFLSFFVKDRFRRKGIAKNLMSILEKEKMPLFIANSHPEKYSLMVFEAKEKALEIVKKSQYSYPINCAEYQAVFKDRVDIFGEHVKAILENNEKSIYYSNPLVFVKKDKPTVEVVEQNKINKITMNRLKEIAPLKEVKKQDKIVKKLPTLKPKVKIS